MVYVHERTSWCELAIMLSSSAAEQAATPWRNQAAGSQREEQQGPDRDRHKQSGGSQAHPPHEPADAHAQLFPI